MMVAGEWGIDGWIDGDSCRMGGGWEDDGWTMCRGWTGMVG